MSHCPCLDIIYLGATKVLGSQPPLRLGQCDAGPAIDVTFNAVFGWILIPRILQGIIDFLFEFILVSKK